jgi:hypothetical protein
MAMGQIHPKYHTPYNQQLATTTTRLWHGNAMANPKICHRPTKTKQKQKQKKTPTITTKRCIHPSLPNY